MFSLLQKLYPMPTPEQVIQRELEAAELDLLHAESRTEYHKHNVTMLRERIERLNKRLTLSM